MDNIDRVKFEAMLNRDEGREAFPYMDSVGKLSIAVGRNLTDRGLRQSEIDFLLRNDMGECIDESKNIPGFIHADSVRQMVIAAMVFNMGLPVFNQFKNMIAAFEEGDYDLAAVEMLDSKWAKQVGPRATRMASMMRTGDYA